MLDSMGKISAQTVKGDCCNNSMKPITASQIVIPGPAAGREPGRA
jgi:hypothetical protein